jgi:hypothetical protein
MSTRSPAPAGAALVELLWQCRYSGQIDDRSWELHCAEIPGLREVPAERTRP